MTPSWPKWKFSIHSSVPNIKVVSAGRSAILFRHDYFFMTHLLALNKSLIVYSERFLTHAPARLGMGGDKFSEVHVMYHRNEEAPSLLVNYLSSRSSANTKILPPLSVSTIPYHWGITRSIFKLNVFGKIVGGRKGELVKRIAHWMNFLVHHILMAIYYDPYDTDACNTVVQGENW